MAENYGPVATTMLFENADVRVWEMDLKPGEVCGTHHHQLDYVLFIISGAKVGVESQQHQPYTLEAFARTAYFIPAGGIESASNVGQTRFREALFELKRAAKPHQQRLGFCASEALAGYEARPGTLRILENDRVRISETALEPGEGSPLPGGRYETVSLVIEGAAVRLVERERGEPVEQDRKPKDVFWEPQGVTRSLLNRGVQRYRQVSVELK